MTERLQPKAVKTARVEANPKPKDTSSRRSRRKLKRQQTLDVDDLSDEIVTNADTSSSHSSNNVLGTKLTKFDVKIARVLEVRRTRAAVHSDRPKVQLDDLLPTPPMNSTRIFIASLGNPPPYATTRHSAGHLLLKALQSHLQLPPFQKSKNYANGLVSFGADVGRPEFTLWQSPSLMNASGPALLKAYNTFTYAVQDSPTDSLPGLVVLYDEMEIVPGRFRVRHGVVSPRGHNGLRSLMTVFQSSGMARKLGSRLLRIGIGIGRPPNGSRTSEDVSRYVLGELTQTERQSIDGKAEELERLLNTEMEEMSRQKG